MERLKRLKERLMAHPLVDLGTRVRERYRKNGAGLFAGALTYHGFLSLFPLLLLAATVLGFLFERDPTSRDEWASRFGTALPGMEQMVSDVLGRASEARGALGLIGAIGVLWTGTGAVRAAGRALRNIHETGPRPPIVRRVLWSLGSLIALGAIFTASATATSVASSPEAGGVAGAGLAVGAFVIGLGMDLVLFLAGYRILTQGEGPPFRELLPGAALGAVGWSALRLVGVWYFARSLSGAQAVYGVFAGTVAILVILSVGARLFMLGAVLNAELSEQNVPPARRQALLDSGMRS